jgi:predicted GIY-YIG superfamily endonuclease
VLRSRQYAELLSAIPRAKSSPTDVYQLFDGDGTLMYVGVSLSLAQRMRQHRQGKRWWPQVARIEVSHCATRQEALFMEFCLIQRLQPRYNVQGQAQEPAADWEVVCAAMHPLQSAPDPEVASPKQAEMLEWLSDWVDQAIVSWEAHKAATRHLRPVTR